MGFQARIFVKIKLSYFVLHFRQIRLMKYDEFDSYCFHDHNHQKYSNVKGLSGEKQEANSRNKSIKRGCERRKLSWATVFQHFGNVVLKCHGINIDPYYTYEIIFHGLLLGISKDILVQSLFFLFKDLLDHKYWLFNLMGASQFTIARSSW